MRCVRPWRTARISRIARRGSPGACCRRDTCTEDNVRPVADETTLRTERLLLRPWRAEDRAPFAALNADPRVMEWFPAPMTAVESNAVADRIEAHFHETGWGLWAIEIPDAEPFIGFVGLNPSDSTLGYPSVEIGWRLAAAHWGHGYAPEAALESLRFGFDELHL